MLSQPDFELLKSHQYCDNASCIYYNEVGADNIRIQSRPKSQVYCKGCKGIWVVTKGTLFFSLKTPISKVASSLQLYASGIGLRATSRESGVTTDSLLDWISKAGDHVNELSAYLQAEMNLDQVQVDEFWSFILKKRNALLKKRNEIVN